MPLLDNVEETYDGGLLGIIHKENGEIKIPLNPSPDEVIVENLQEGVPYTSRQILKTEAKNDSRFYFMPKPKQNNLRVAVAIVYRERE